MLFYLLLLAFEDPRALIERGVLALDANDLVKARAQFETAAKQAPTYAVAWMLLAQTRAKQGELKGAGEAAALAEKYGGKDPAILLGLANFHGSTMGDLSRAAAFGERYAVLVPGDLGRGCGWLLCIFRWASRRKRLRLECGGSLRASFLWFWAKPIWNARNG